MAEKNDRVRDSISNHSTSEDIARMFDNPRVLVGSIYSDSESEPQSEVPAEPKPGDDQENDCRFVEERSSDKDTDSSSEVERSKIKKLRLSRSPKKLANCNGRPSSSRPGLSPFVSKSTPPKKKTPVSAKAKSKSNVHTPVRPSSEISRPKKKLTVCGIGNQSTKDACVDDLGNISNLLTEVLKRLERIEAKLESVEHKLESSTSLSSSSGSEKKEKFRRLLRYC